MKTSKTQQLIERLKNGEVVVCPKCQKGHIVYSQLSGRRYPDIYCDNKSCAAKIVFN